MKKIVQVLLALSIFLSTSIHVSANEQHIDGRGEHFTPEAEIEVNARLGKFDNSVPAPHPPVGDIRWINVALPTAVLFQSDDLNGGNVEDLVSANYEMRNYSHMGIAISLNDFTNVMNPSSMHYIGELFLIGYNGITTNSLRLMDHNGLAAENGLFLSMRGNFDYKVVTNAEGDEGIEVDPSVAIFGFVGGLKTVPEVGVNQPVFEMIFTFESIERYPTRTVGAQFLDTEFASFSQGLLSRELSSLQHVFPNNQHINSETQAKIEVESMLRHEPSIELPIIEPPMVQLPIITPEPGGINDSDITGADISTTPENSRVPETGVVMKTGILLLSGASLVIFGFIIAAKKKR